MLILILWHVTPHRVIKVYWCFGETYRLQLQGWRASEATSSMWAAGQRTPDTTWQGISYLALFSRYCSGDQIKENEVDGTCRTHGDRWENNKLDLRKISFEHVQFIYLRPGSDKSRDNIQMDVSVPEHKIRRISWTDEWLRASQVAPATSMCIYILLIASYSWSHIQTCDKFLKFTFLLLSNYFLNSLMQYMFRLIWSSSGASHTQATAYKSEFPVLTAARDL